MADGDREESSRRPSLRRRFLSPRTAISFIVLGVILALLVTRFDVAWGDTWDLMRNMNPWWFALAVLVHYSTFIFRGARWRLLLENATKGDDPPLPSLPVLYYGRVILMSWFANSVTFFRMGDAYRVYVCSEDTKVSIPRVAGTFLADRLIDMGVVVGLMLLGIGILLGSGRIDPPLLLAVVAGALLGAILAGLVAMVLARRWLAPRLPHRVATVYHHFHDGTMGSFGRLHLVFALGVLGWLSEIGRLFFVVQAVGVPVAAGLLVFVPMANGLLSAIPFTPGGLGVVETSISGLLQLQPELTFELAVAIALLDRAISYLSIIVAGGAAFAVRQLGRAGRLRPAMEGN